MFAPFGKKIRQTRPSWTAQYFSLSFVGQICKFNVLLGTKNYNSSLAFWLEQIRQTWCPLASSVWQGTLGQKFNVPLKEKTNFVFVWIGTKSYNSFLASFLWDFSAPSVWHEKLDKLGHLLLAGKNSTSFWRRTIKKCVPFCCGRLQTSIVLYDKLEIHSSLQDGVLFGWVQSFWPEMEILTILTTSDTMLGPRN